MFLATHHALRKLRDVPHDDRPHDGWLLNFAGCVRDATARKSFEVLTKVWSIRLARMKANDLGGPSRLLRMAVSHFWGGRDLCLSSF